MILADGAIALSTLGLALLFALDKVQIWEVFAIVALRSLGGSFHSTAMQASTSLLVPESHYTRVAGFNQTLRGIVNILAPPAGALLLGLLSTQGLLLIDVATAAIAIAILAFFKIPHPKAEAERKKSSYFVDLKAGFAYVAAWPGLMALMALAMFLNFLLSPAGSLMPLLVTGHFGKGALELGGLESLFGAGMIAGGLVLGAWGGFKRRMSTSIFGIVGLGIGTCLVGLAPANMFWLASLAFFIVGFGNPIANGPLGAIIQAVVKPEMQGRVLTLIGSAATAMMPISLLIAGPISDRFGIRAWYIVGGGLCALVALLARFVPVLMNIESADRKGETDKVLEGA